MSTFMPFCQSVVILLSLRLVSCQVSIDPVNPVRPGEIFPVSCITSSKGDSTCKWEINDREVVIKQNGRLRPRAMDNSNCSVEGTAADDLSGKWTCKLFSHTGGMLVGTSSTTISVISFGSVNYSPASTILETTAGEVKEVKCIVSNVRPLPDIIWELGNQLLEEKEFSITSEKRPKGLFEMKSVLTRTFHPAEHSKTLRCRVQAPWLDDSENTAIETRLNVNFPPLPQSAIKVYGFQKSSFGEMQVTVYANPRPHHVTWILPTNSSDNLEVEPTLDDPVDENYRGFLGEDNGNGSYTYRLSIESVEARDSEPGIYLEVINLVNNESQTTRYLAQAFIGAQPSQASSSGVGLSQCILLLNAIVLTSLGVNGSSSWIWRVSCLT